MHAETTAALRRKSSRICLYLENTIFTRFVIAFSYTAKALFHPAETQYYQHMKSTHIYRTEYCASALFFLYSVALHAENIGTLLSELTSFSNVWLVFAAFFFFAATWRRRHNRSFWWSLKPWQKKAGLAMFTTALIIALVNLICIARPVVSDSPQADTVILLGGGIYKDGTLPKSVQARAETAAAYLLQKPEAVIVVTGGSLYNLPEEAPAIKALLIKKGVSPDRILVEQNALDTIQNFSNSAAVLASYRHCPVEEIIHSEILVVTSYFHLARAQYLARRMGFTRISGLGSHTPLLHVLNSYSREICAWLKLSLRILLTGKPVAVSGNP